LSSSGIGTSAAQPFEHRSPDVLVDHRGPHVGHLAALGEAVDHERVERIGELEFLGLALYGSRRAVARLTGALRLL
jgi:hypothetical protein